MRASFVRQTLKGLLVKAIWQVTKRWGVFPGLSRFPRQLLGCSLHSVWQWQMITFMAATPPAERAQALKVSTLGRTDTPGWYSGTRQEIHTFSLFWFALFSQRLYMSELGKWFLIVKKYAILILVFLVAFICHFPKKMNLRKKYVIWRFKIC